MQLSLTEIAKTLGGEVAGKQVRAPGPGHSAADRSLVVKLNDAGDDIIVHSFANDDPIECKDFVRSKLGLPAWRPKNGNGRAMPQLSLSAIANILKPPDETAKPTATVEQKRRALVTRYDYVGLNGQLLYQVERWEPKDFTQRRPDGKGGWIYKNVFDGVQRVPYRWKELATDIAEFPDAPVFICEGEKDCDNVRKLGLTATCIAGSVWTPEIGAVFRDRDVIILEDNDEAGRDRAAKAAQTLSGTAASVRLVSFADLPAKGDVSDWLKIDEKHDAAALIDRCRGVPLWEGVVLSTTPEGVVTVTTPSSLETVTSEANQTDEKPQAENTAPPKIHATPYVLPDPTAIPMRDWLYGTHLIRAFASATFAPGAAGKTSLKLVEAISMATGRALLGTRIRRRCRVWYWNGEDPQEEIDRRIGAICLHYGVSREELDGWLFVDTGRGMKIVIAAYDPKSGNKIFEPVVKELIETIVENKIDVFIVDPFVKSYRVAENDNGAMDMVATQWVDIAEIANVAIELVHHTKKLGGTEANVESGRGAGSVAAAMRSVDVVNKMLAEEGKKVGIEGFELRHYFSVFDDKPNMTISPENKTWYKLIPISLGNGPDGGDSVGVATSWKWPDPLAGVTGADFDRAAVAIKAGNWRKDPQAKAWVGKPIGQALKLDLDNKADRAKINQLIKLWIDNGSLIEIEAEDMNRQMRKFVKVAEGD
jgi:5S rRNA maturation endonuclease (ribonuclease M5)